jgi:hypothetical protein
MLAGIGVGGYVLWERSRLFSRKARDFAELESEFRSSVQFYRDHLEEGRELVRQRKLEREKYLAARKSDDADTRRTRVSDLKQQPIACGVAF